MRKFTLMLCGVITGTLLTFTHAKLQEAPPTAPEKQAAKAEAQDALLPEILTPEVAAAWLNPDVRGWYVVNSLDDVLHLPKMAVAPRKLMLEGDKVSRSILEGVIRRAPQLEILWFQDTPQLRSKDFELLLQLQNVQGLLLHNAGISDFSIFLGRAAELGFADSPKAKSFPNIVSQAREWCGRLRILVHGDARFDAKAQALLSEAQAALYFSKVELLEWNGQVLSDYVCAGGQLNALEHLSVEYGKECAHPSVLSDFFDRNRLTGNGIQGLDGVRSLWLEIDTNREDFLSVLNAYEASDIVPMQKVELLSTYALPDAEMTALRRFVTKPWETSGWSRQSSISLAWVARWVGLQNALEARISPIQEIKLQGFWLDFRPSGFGTNDVDAALLSIVQTLKGLVRFSYSSDADDYSGAFKSHHELKRLLPKTEIVVDGKEVTGRQREGLLLAAENDQSSLMSGGDLRVISVDAESGRVAIAESQRTASIEERVWARKLLGLSVVGEKLDDERLVESDLAALGVKGVALFDYYSDLWFSKGKVERSADLHVSLARLKRVADEGSGAFASFIGSSYLFYGSPSIESLIGLKSDEVGPVAILAIAKSKSDPVSYFLLIEGHPPYFIQGEPLGEPISDYNEHYEWAARRMPTPLWDGEKFSNAKALSCAEFKAALGLTD